MKTTKIALSAVAGLMLLNLAHSSGCTSNAYTPGTGPGSGTGGKAGSSGGSGGAGGSAGVSGGNSGGASGVNNGGTSGGSNGGAAGTSTSAAGGASGGGVGGTSSIGIDGGPGGTGAGGAIPGTCSGGKLPSGMACIAWNETATGGPPATGSAATVTVDPQKTVGTVGADYVGFSMEKTQMTNCSLTGENTDLINLMKLLGTPQLRIGANDVDNTSWGGTGDAPTTPHGAPFPNKINTGMVDQLCAFLGKAGIKLNYGVNYYANNSKLSAEEMTYVMGKCGSSIFGVELGNEIDKNGYGGWPGQQAKYEAFATAILAVPGTLLIGPAATDGSYKYLTPPFAAAISKKFGEKFIQVTQHNYVAGSQTPGATGPALQSETDRLRDLADTMNKCANIDNKVPKGYRMGEFNSFSQHGREGVSDTLIAGLWGIEFMAMFAERGCVGVNFHGGETGMDGTRPFTYEPIMMTNGKVIQVQPTYLAMLFFVLAGQGSMLSTTVTAPVPPNFTAHAIKSNGFTSVLLINRNTSNDVKATVDLGAPASKASAIYLKGKTPGQLTAPAKETTLAGVSVSPSGSWTPEPPFAQTVTGNTVLVAVPAVTAVLIHVLP